MTLLRDSCVKELRARPPRAVVMGGSAGGVEALRVLLPALPGGSGVPALVVIHVSADARNVWALLFERSAAVVREAEDKDVALPGNVYIAPPNYHLLVDGAGCLSLSVDARVRFARPSIDVLFESAAWAFRERLLGIVLSGANDDGASGLAAIARAGGHTWVQTPDTASAPLMPRCALEAVPGARVLGLGDMVHIFQSGALSVQASEVSDD
jgi:two-component system, chemotaxis family, protein-glutamate methylesterase/glutaminase